MKLLATARFLDSIPLGNEAEVHQAMKAADAAYGHPHLHAGIGLRRIPPFMECRCGLDLRLIFQREKGTLIFHFCGSHAQVTAFLKNAR